MSHVHLQVKSIDDRDDGLLSRVELWIYTFVDGISKSKNIHKDMRIMDANRFTLPYIS